MLSNQHQERKFRQLQGELSKYGSAKPLTKLGVSDGYLFTEVDGVTVAITRKSHNVEDRGGFIIPAVRTYKEVHAPSNLDAAVIAGKLFKDQKSKDDLDLAKACAHPKGHLGPIIDFDWFCNNQNCPCHFAAEEERSVRKYRSGVS